jgi:predicted ribosome quality control (RQC) complex YloA/Tae2 family protein
LDDFLQERTVAIGAVQRWIRRLEGALVKLSAQELDPSVADALEIRAKALLSAPAPPRGTRSMALTIWTIDGATVESVELDPAVSAREQAQAWLHRARKLRRTVERKELRERELRSELDDAGIWKMELESWAEVECARSELRAREARLQELRRRLLPRGLWPQPPRAPETPRQDGPLRWILPGGWILLAGRSGTENDFLTGRIARSDDLWFHAAHVPGSHVILKSPDGKPTPVPQALLETAAGVAAWLSKLRAQERADVSYTQRRHVRKPRKAPAGSVVLEHSATISVRPIPPPRGEGSAGKAQ